MSRKLSKALIGQKKNVEPYNQKLDGILGIVIGGDRKVEVPNRNSYVYVRLRNSQSELIQAFNNKVAPVFNLPVLVERQGNRYVVIDVDTQRYDNNWSSYSPYLARHGNTHSFDLENGGGGDVVWVHSRQFMPLLAFPSGSVGSPNLVVAPYILKKENGTWLYVGNTGTASFTPYNPPNSGTAVMGLIALNTDTGNPYLIIGSGSSFSDTITGTSQIYSYIPPMTNPAHIPIAAVRLVSGTNRLTWDNIYDVRQFLHPITTGSAGGLSSIAVQDEAVPQGNATTFDFAGANVSVSISGSVARVYVTGSSSPGGFTGDANAVVLTDGSGNLVTEDWLRYGVAARPYLDLGADVVGKETNAGRMGYETFGDGFFFIVGAGTGTGVRRVKVFDELYVGADQILPFNQEAVEDYIGSMFTRAQSFGQNLGVISTYNDASGTVGLDAQSPADTRYGRIDGWQVHTGTWSRHSADAPNYVVSVSPYTHGIIFAGQKVDLFQGASDKYFFVQKVEFSGSVGFLTLYGGTDYSLTTGAITGAKYSFDKVPVGFPIEPDKWSQSASNSSNTTKSTPSGSVWYGDTELTPTGLNIDLPIGCWRVSYKAQIEGTAGAATTIGVQSTLSTSPTSETIPSITTAHTFASLTGAGQFVVSPEVIITVTSKTRYYMNILTGAAGLATIALRGGRTPTVITAVCAYL